MKNISEELNNRRMDLWSAAYDDKAHCIGYKNKDNVVKYANEKLEAFDEKFLKDKEDEK